MKKFVGAYKPAHSLLDRKIPLTVWSFDLPPHYFEHKRQQVEGLDNSFAVIEEIGKEYAELSGRHYHLFEEYKMDDAEVAIITLGSSAGTAKESVNMMREQGKKVGLIKLRVFRPFPFKALAKALEGIKVVGVMDRSIAFGAEGGPAWLEVRSALYGGNTPVLSFVYGLGGRDIANTQIVEVFERLLSVAETGDPGCIRNFVGLREPAK